VSRVKEFAIKPAERLKVILERVESEGEASISDLSIELNVSEMTVRRDIERLEKSGVLRRRLGKAVKGASNSFEPPFAIRTETFSEEKANIAREVAAHIDDMEAVFLDGGSTGVAIARELSSRRLTICTPSLRVADVLRTAPDVQLILSGGFMRRGEESLTGAPAVSTIQSFRFDTYVMTVSGIDLQHGFMEWNVDDATVKRSALAASNRCIVAADSSKFDQLGFVRIADIEQAFLIVTDAGIPSDVLEEFLQSGSRVTVAP
jgi:DeoR/GlpR family transcriptional regulator of sugar metabolism